MQGWRAGVNGSVSRTQTPFKDDQLDGASTGVSVDLGRTWVLSSAWSMASMLSASRLSSALSLTGAELSSSQLEKLAWTNTWSFESRPTRASIRTTLSSSSRAQTLLSSSSKEQARYHYLDLSTQFQTTLGAGSPWIGRVNGLARLASSGKSDANEQFSLGGADTVRGFDAGASSADKGHALQLELRYRPAGASETLKPEVYLFADTGQTWSERGRTRIASVGLGLQTRLSENLGVDLLATRQVKSVQEKDTRLMMRLVGSW